MADLLSILSGASSSLAAQRALLAIASHNIDNASNPGYARQRAEIEALSPAEQVGGAWIGRGAGLTTVTQARDQFLEAQIPQMLGSSGRSTAESDALQAFHALDPQATGGLGDAIAGFYSGLRALAQNPSDPGLRTAFLGQAQVLAQTFNRTAQTVEATRSGLDARVGGLVQSVNAEAAAVAQLNGQIQQASGAGGTPNDLLDLRQQHLDKLAELTGGTPVATSDGAVNVVLAGGAPLVSGNRAGKLVTLADTDNGGHLRLLLGPPDGSPAQTISQQALGGTLGGSVAARDGALKKAGDDVDQLASDLAGKMNAAHAAGFGLDGVTGRPLFTIAAGAPGAARSMMVALTSAAQIATSSTLGTPGDAGAAQALLATESAPLSGVPGDPDVQSTLSSIISQFGGSALTANAFSEQDVALKDQLVAMRQSYSGVSIDEEMIALQKAQRGYEAVTKVIKTADEMMQTLMSLLG